MFTATVSDYTRHRYIFTLLPTLLGLTGFIILLVVHNNNHLQYAALFLAASGVYSAMPIIVCWFNTNREFSFYLRGGQRLTFCSSVAGHKRRAVATGWQVGFGNSKNIQHHTCKHFLT